MSRMLQLNLDPEPRILRQFGIIALFGFGLLAFAAWTESFIFAMGLGSARMAVVSVFGGLGVLSLVFSLVAPKLNRPIYVGLALLTYPIGLVLSYLIMATLFFVIIGPIGLTLRALGKDPMRRSIDRAARSYWTDVERQRGSADYFRQF